MTHPYTSLADHQFWSRAMVAPAPGHIDPVTVDTIIRPTDKVATMGSCFAQHISRNLASAGFGYFVAEPAPVGMTTEESTRRNFGTFSARYGNVYTARQAIQLFDRAFDVTHFEDHVWQRDNVYVDGFRPQVEPLGQVTYEDVLVDRMNHLACVRKLFRECDWLVFTLGLTEAWMSTSDKAIFPVAPGVAGGKFCDELHQFINFSFTEVMSDIEGLVQRLREVNQAANILLTVSPVPLIATYEKRHILTSTVASKSILRSVADEAERRFKNVSYFPSYEIVTSAANGGRYFADDLRQVTPIGVNHVMRVFAKHYLQAPNTQPAPSRLQQIEVDEQSPLVCDEETIENAIKASGFSR